MFELGDLRLLIRQRIVQRRQQVLLMGQFCLDIDYFFVIHRGYQVVAGIQTLRPRTDFFNPGGVRRQRQAPATCILAVFDTGMTGNACP